MNLNPLHLDALLNGHARIGGIIVREKRQRHMVMVISQFVGYDLSLAHIKVQWHSCKWL